MELFCAGVPAQKCLLLSVFIRGYPWLKKLRSTQPRRLALSAVPVAYTTLVNRIPFANKPHGHYKTRTMNKPFLFSVASASCVFLAACDSKTGTTVDVTAAPWECIAAEVTIGTNSIDTVVRYNKVTGEAQLLNAASFASKATGAQGNVIGWVPLGDLRNAVQELVQREQAAQQQMPTAPAATPEPSPAKKKN